MESDQQLSKGHNSPDKPDVESEQQLPKGNNSSDKPEVTWQTVSETIDKLMFYSFSIVLLTFTAVFGYLLLGREQNPSQKTRWP